MASVKAIVKPELLIWARKSAGFKDVAEAAIKLDVKPEQLSRWEDGSDQPTIPQLRKASEVYRRSLAVFYLPAAPKETPPIHDFRTVKSGLQAIYSPKLVYEIRRASHRREIALDLYSTVENEEPKPISITATLSDDVEATAKKIRQYLGVTEAQQSSWSNDYEALNGWKAAIESKDVLVFQASGIDVAEMRGFSIATQPLPAIILNIQDAPLARVFTLIHEFTHIILKQEGVCDLREGQSQVEVFCNAVAGSTLVPGPWFLSTDEVRRHSGSWADDEIRYLARKFNVSKQVLLRRLLHHSLISQTSYMNKQLAYEKQAETRPDKSKKVIVTVPVKTVAASGKLFSRLVVSAYKGEEITGSDLSDYLSVKLRHLPGIETALNKQAAL